MYMSMSACLSIIICLSVPFQLIYIFCISLISPSRILFPRSFCQSTGHCSHLIKAQFCAGESVEKRVCSYTIAGNVLVTMKNSMEWVLKTENRVTIWYWACGNPTPGCMSGKDGNFQFEKQMHPSGIQQTLCRGVKAWKQHKCSGKPLPSSLLLPIYFLGVLV